MRTMRKKCKQLVNCDLGKKILEKKLDTNEVVGGVYLRDVIGKSRTAQYDLEAKKQNVADRETRLTILCDLTKTSC